MTTQQTLDTTNHARKGTVCPFSSLSTFLDDAHQRSFNNSAINEANMVGGTEDNTSIASSLTDDVAIGISSSSGSSSGGHSSSTGSVGLIDNDDLDYETLSMKKEAILRKYYGGYVKKNDKINELGNNDNETPLMTRKVNQLLNDGGRYMSSTTTTTTTKPPLPLPKNMKHSNDTTTFTTTTAPIPTRSAATTTTSKRHCTNTFYPPPPFPMANTPSSSCANCGLKGKPLRTLSMCTCCQSPSYWICSPTCATQDMDRHDTECMKYLELVQQVAAAENEEEDDDVSGDDEASEEDINSSSNNEIGKDVKDEDFILLSSSTATLTLHDSSDEDEDDSTDDSTEDDDDDTAEGDNSSDDDSTDDDDNDGSTDTNSNDKPDVRMVLWTLCYGQLVHATKKHQERLGVKYMTNPPHFKHCEYCFKPTNQKFTNPVFDVELRPCPLCHTVRYCSKECQLLDFHTNHYKNNHCCRLIRSNNNGTDNDGEDNGNSDTSDSRNTSTSTTSTTEFYSTSSDSGDTND